MHSWRSNNHPTRKSLTQTQHREKERGWRCEREEKDKRRANSISKVNEWRKKKRPWANERVFMIAAKRKITVIHLKEELSVSFDIYSHTYVTCYYLWPNALTHRLSTITAMAKHASQTRNLIKKQHLAFPLNRSPFAVFYFYCSAKHTGNYIFFYWFLIWLRITWA